MLAAAVAKINGFTYSPNQDVFWKQGYSQENSYIYVTTRYLDTMMLESIANDIMQGESLLICVPAFDEGLDKHYNNITVKKIPQSILNKCEFGIENYNLNIIDLPELDNEKEEE